MADQPDNDAKLAGPDDVAASAQPRRFRLGAGKSPDGFVPGRDAAAAYDTAEFNAPLAGLEARDITAWFGDHKVLDSVSLTMPPARSPR